MPGAEQPTRFWIGPTVLMVVFSLVGIAAGAVIFAVTTHDVRLAPWPSSALSAAAFLAPLAGAAVGIPWLMRGWRRARPETRRRRRLLTAIGIALALVGATALGTGLNLNKTLFASHMVKESHSPGGASAYVHAWSFVCGHELWFQEPGALTMRKLDSVGTECGKVPGVEWQGERPHLVGVVASSVGLWVGPH